MSALSDVETAFPARMITIRTFSDLKGASTSAVFSQCLDSHTIRRETAAKRSDEFRTLGHGAAGPFDHQCVCSSAVGIDDCGPGSSIVSGIPSSLTTTSSSIRGRQTTRNIKDHSGPPPRRR
ncbi:hypothetical protein QR685DRAFT_197308 [Neurospora intermedia]|uniref:Questionable protein n=1 Tax=Neurospora intermedia TaxID=5142 RepID=A0ABR3CX02_NEUIN